MIRSNHIRRLAQRHTFVRRNATIDATAGASSSTTTKQRLVVSRKAYQKHYKPVENPKIKPKDDEKPWPQSVQIGGAVVVAIAVPYFTLWFICGNPTLRDMVKDYIPLDKLRRHYGTEDPTVLPYSEALELKDAPLESYLFPQEPSYVERSQQAEVDRQSAATVSTTIIGAAGQIIERKIPANTSANVDNVLKSIGADEVVSDLSISFAPSDDELASEGTSSNSSSQFQTSEISQEFDMSPASSSSSSQIAKVSQIYSPWQYQPQNEQQQQQQNGSRGGSGRQISSDDAIETSRLEYTITKLESDLKDPACTRDIDDMVAELKVAKKSLKRQRWKNRVGGLVSTIVGK